MTNCPSESPSPPDLAGAIIVRPEVLKGLPLRRVRPPCLSHRDRLTGSKSRWSRGYPRTSFLRPAVRLEDAVPRSHAFSEALEGPLRHSILGRARERGLISIELTDIRRYTRDNHNTADDYQFGGGAGMVMKPEPIFEAVEDSLSRYDQDMRREIQWC